MKYYMFNGFDVNEPKKNKRIKKQSDQKTLNKNKIFKLCLGVFIVIVFIVLTVLYTKNEIIKNAFDKYIFRKEAYENKLPIIELTISNNTGIFSYNSKIAILNQNILTIYNKSGQAEETLNIQISTPIFSSAGEYLCIAEKNGQKIYLIKNKTIQWEKEIEGKISKISVNKNGYVSNVITGTNYKAVVKTYDSKGKELFITKISTANVIDTDISNDNKYLAIAEANFSGIVIQSSIRIISIEEAQKNSEDSIIYKTLADSNDLIINVKYDSKNSLICMYDNHIDIIKGETKEKLRNFENENLLFSDINLNYDVIEIMKKSTGLFNAKSEMIIINTNTKKEALYEIEGTPKALSSYEDIICINLGTEAIFIKDTGWVVKKYKSSQEIKNIVLCNELAGIIYKDKIELLSL